MAVPSFPLWLRRLFLTRRTACSTPPTRVLLLPDDYFVELRSLEYHHQTSGSGRRLGTSWLQPVTITATRAFLLPTDPDGTRTHLDQR